MKLQILCFFTILNCSIGLACQNFNNFVSTNQASSNGVKFQLRDELTNHYLLVDSTTLLLRVVNSEEFEASKQEQMIWFTACNDFSSTSTNPNVIQRF